MRATRVAPEGPRRSSLARTRSSFRALMKRANTASPIVGAGTWADNSTCAVSCTGVGEEFIRFGVAQRIADLVQVLDQQPVGARHLVLRAYRDPGLRVGLMAEVDEQARGVSFGEGLRGDGLGGQGVVEGVEVVLGPRRLV